MNSVFATQTSWIASVKVSTGEVCKFPRQDFEIYMKNDFSGKFYVNRAERRQFRFELFSVKEVLPNGLVRGNFLNNPPGDDFFIPASDLEKWSLGERVMMRIVFSPLVTLETAWQGILAGK